MNVRGYHADGRPFKPGHREAGIITYAREENFRDDGPPNTIGVGVKLVDGGQQGYGGLFLPDAPDRKAFIDALCDTFAVHKLSLLEGKACMALRNFSTWNSPIVGLESIDTGKVFLSRTFQRERMKMKPEHPLVEAQASINRSIKRCYEEIKRHERELQTIGGDYAEHHD